MFQLMFQLIIIHCSAPEPSYIPEPSYVPEPPHIIEPHHEPSYSAPEPHYGPPKPVRSRRFSI